MRRYHHRAALTEAIAEATARFHADLQRLARTVLRGELDSRVATLEPTLLGAGTRAPHVKPVVEPRRSPAAGLSKPAAAATARRTPVARTSKPAAAARMNKPDAAGTSKPAAAGTSKSAAGTRTSKRAAAAGTHAERAAVRAEPPTAELPLAIVEFEPAVAMRAEPTAAPMAAVPEDPAVAIAEPDPVPTAVVAVSLVEPTTAAPHVESAPVAEPMTAATNEELPWEERARTRREESAERRQQRQERARIRREAAEMRAGSAAAAGARAESTTTAAREALAGSAGARALGRGVQHGTVKWFSQAKGYGFITANDGTDAFVHHSSISSEGFRTLSEGQAVSYEEVESARGLLAVNVIPTVRGSVHGETTSEYVNIDARVSKSTTM